MVRLLFILALTTVAFTSPAFAFGEDDARQLCAQVLNDKFSIPVATSMGFGVSGNGERFVVKGRANYSGAKNALVGCKINKGRVTSIGDIF